MNKASGVAIYGLNPGEAGEYARTGEVHLYCSSKHAARHAKAEGFTPPDYSAAGPAAAADLTPYSVCEVCGKLLAVTSPPPGSAATG